MKNIKNISHQNSANVKRFDQALPQLIRPENCDLKPNESAQIYYTRLEPFRRICEARAVLRWIAGAYFDSEKHLVNCHRTDHSVACYFAGVAVKRGKAAASILKNDALDLFSSVIERDPSLQDLLYSQLKLLR